MAEATVGKQHKYLDYGGLETLVDKIKKGFNDTNTSISDLEDRVGNLEDNTGNDLVIRYRDKSNQSREVIYNGTEGAEVDLETDGVYYATTSTTATKVSHSLKFYDSEGEEREYNGQYEVDLRDTGIDYAGFADRAGSADAAGSLDDGDYAFTATQLADNFTEINDSLDNKATKATTLAGYGITDAYTITATDTKFGQYLPLVGGALTGPLVFNGSDVDRNVIRINCTNGDASKIGEWGYTLKFLGSGSGVNNALALYGDNSTSTTQNLATKWLNDGTMYGRSILPHTTNTFDLGSSSLKWSNVYATSFNGNATSATKTGDGTNTLYAEKNNEINFGGTSESSIIYFGCRAKDSKAIPSKFIFGGTTGTANITAAGFTKEGSSSNYFLLGDGSHTLRSNYATVQQLIGENGKIINWLNSEDYASKYASGSIGLDNQNVRVQVYEYASNDWVLKFDSDTVDTTSAAALLKGQMLTIYSGTRGSKSKIVISECSNYIRDFYFHIKTLDSTFSTPGITAKYEGYNASDSLAYTASSTIGTWGSWHVAPNNEQNLKRAIIYLNEELANSAIVIQGYRVYQTNPGINVLPGKSQSAFESDSLTTARTLWGQSFNGTANVSGDMSSVGSITMSKALTINGSDADTANLHFGRTSYNYITGPSGSTIHMCPGGISKSSNSGYVFASTAFYPGTKDAYSIGTAAKQWGNIYGKTLYEDGTSLVDKYAAKDEVLLAESSLGSTEVNQIWADIFNSPVNSMNVVEVEEVVETLNNILYEE